MPSRLKTGALDGIMIGRELLSKSIHYLKHRNNVRSVLVIHDVDDWAIDHVFSQWFASTSRIRITRANWDRLATTRSFACFDLILFGYYDIYLRFGHDPKKSAVVIHDPCELFPEVPDWKFRSPLEGRIEKLKEFKAVIVISKEMEKILCGYGVRCFRIPTMSRLNISPSNKSPEFPLKIVSVFKNTKRKNANLLRKLAKYGDQNDLWKVRLQTTKLPVHDYISLLESHPVYLCTSWQEGGPLPAMDAISSGAVLISSRVGQLQEFLVHGESALFCESEEEFIHSIDMIQNDENLFKMLQENSIMAYFQSRNHAEIQVHAENVLTQIMEC